MSAIETDPIIAFAGEPALAAQFDQHALAIGAVLGDRQPPIDPAAIGRRREEHQIKRLDREPRGQRDEQPDQIDRIEIELQKIEHGGYSGCDGSKWEPGILMPMAIRSARKRGRTPVAWKWPWTEPSGAVPVRTYL